MADRNFQNKKRNVIKRHRKPIMLITAEGKNKTEKQYYLSFQEQHGKYVIRYVGAGLDTDPEGLLKTMRNAWERNELFDNNGDKAYIVLDMDCSPEKINLVSALQKKDKNIRFIISNPCFEVWFILHYVYTTHQYKDSKEPKKELTKYIPEYEESMEVSEILLPKLENAYKNVDKLKKHYEAIGTSWGDADCNPMTDAGEILKELGI